MLSKDQFIRYSRQMILPGIGEAGQQKLLSARVLVVGAGGLGSSALYYLAAAGIGTLGIADGDRVSLTNLHRQILHFTDDLDKPKTNSAAEKLMRLNPGIRIVTHDIRIEASNVDRVIPGYDFIVDGTDNFDSKFLINDACVKLKKAFSHGGILGFQGQTFTYVPGSACYRCVFREPPSPGACPSCAEAGVLGPLAGLIGTVQAAESIKFLLGSGKLLRNRLLTVDASDMEFRTIDIRRNPLCPACGKAGV